MRRYRFRSLALNGQEYDAFNTLPPYPVPPLDGYERFWQSLIDIHEHGDLAAGNVNSPVSQGSYCGNLKSSIYFIAPVDLEVGDTVFFRLSSGEPLMVIRYKTQIWRAEAGHGVTIRFDNVTINEELRRQLMGEETDDG